MITTKVKDFLSTAAIILAAVLWCWMGFSFLFERKDGVYYNCSLAEISPDFPVEAKELCRKNRSGRV